MSFQTKKKKQVDRYLWLPCYKSARKLWPILTNVTIDFQSIVFRRIVLENTATHARIFIISCVRVAGRSKNPIINESLTNLAQIWYVRRFPYKIVFHDM